MPQRKEGVKPGALFPLHRDGNYCHVCIEDKSKLMCKSKCSRSASLGGRVALKTLLTIQIDMESASDCYTVSGKAYPKFI